MMCFFALIDRNVQFVYQNTRRSTLPVALPLLAVHGINVEKRSIFTVHGQVAVPLHAR
jgi:hypothetical protein